MRRKHSLFYHILIFVLAQIAWLMLLGIWIYWYVSNYIIMEKVGDQLSMQISDEASNVLTFVGGIVLLVGISFGMSMTFRYLNVQLKLNRMYDNFIANVTHELKSPLSSIQLYLETLGSRNVPEEKRIEFYKLMMNDTTRLRKLINSILEIFALEQKKIAHDFQVYEAEPLIRKLLSEAAEQYKLNKLNLSITGSVDCQCVIDKAAVQIVFDNLVDNAVKYSVSNPEINVELRTTGKKLIVYFGDNGIGIPVKDQKQVFNKFFRLYNNEIPNVKGSGLGLFWVKEIIKSHGGGISIVQEEKNSGVTFRIELPVFRDEGNRFMNKLLKSSTKREE